jgi:hypothetical protein
MIILAQLRPGAPDAPCQPATRCGAPRSTSSRRSHSASATPLAAPEFIGKLLAPSSGR